MEFEFDENKSRSKKLKHGMDFVEAQVLWQDDNRIEVPARTSDDPRLVIVGKIGARVWAAVVTYREGKVRIISVRRARQREVELYESRSV
ncbi:BrnT family toxin [bacterium]|nr:BrnT family toxin [bacterium]